MASSAIPAYSYRKVSLFGKREWRPGQSSAASGAGPRRRTRNHSGTANATHPPPELTIATYNVWFNNMVNDIRYTAIAKLLVEMNTDIVCLQEVNQNFLGHLKADTGIQAAYMCLGANGETIGSGSHHGVVVLVNRKTLSVSQGSLVDLPDTRDHRKLLSARMTGVAGQHAAGISDLVVATAHLESTRAEYAETARRAQLEFIRAQLPASGAIFCGDTNLCNDGETDLPEELGFRDAWLDAGNSPDAPTSNSLYNSANPPRRIDRVLMMGDSVRAIGASLFGETPLKITQPIEADLFLSDHKGLHVRLRI